MKSKRKCTITFFGALKSAAGGKPIELDVYDESTIADIRSELYVLLGESSSLLSASAFGSQTRVLNDSERLGDICELAVLPPVCGG